MCLIFYPPDDTWTTSVDGGRELIRDYPSDLPYSTNWFPEDEGEKAWQSSQPTQPSRA